MSIRTITIIIAEDETENREFLRNIIEQHSEFKIVAEVSNGKELVDSFPKLKPQVVLVDIEMPQVDGMTAVKNLLEDNEQLIVVFITGHPEFAVEAFEISSFDYILKPFKPCRIKKTLDKIRDRIVERESEIQKLSNIFKSSEKLFIKTGQELHFIDVNSIYFIEKEKKKTVIHTTSNRYETIEPLNDLENRLNSMNFFRSHKSYLINLRIVEKIIPWASSSYLVKFFNCNNDALISRSKVKMLYELLEIHKE